MRGRALLDHLAADGGQLLVGRVERVDRGGAREDDQLDPGRGRLHVGLAHGLGRARHLPHGLDLGAVPAQLGRHRLQEQLPRLRLQAFGDHDQGPKRPEGDHLHHRGPGPGDALGLLDDSGRHRHRGHLAAGHLGSDVDGLAVHQGEDRDRAEAVQSVDRARADADQAPAGRHQPDLRLGRPARFQPGTADGGGQPDGGGVLVQVRRLQLRHMELDQAPQAVEMPRPEHGSLPQVGAQVVGQHAARDLRLRGGLTGDPERSHRPGVA